MGKSKSKVKETFFYCNILILIGLVGLYYYLSNKPVKEGIRDMNCCGGIEAGVHYSETDTKPPPYVQRCFKSSKDTSGTGTVYTWDGFPCTGAGSSDCCNGHECVATTKGGYCSSPDGDFIFHRRNQQSKPYLKHSNDNVIDISDVNDMKDYYYDRRGSRRGESREMSEFEKRREKNEAYMEKQLLNKKIRSTSEIDKSKEKLDDQKKNIQIISALTIVHMLFVTIFAITIRELIVVEIEGFYQLIYKQYLSFAGKTISTPVDK